MYKKIIVILIYTLFIGISITITSDIIIKNVIADSGILFSDDFNDGNNNGWIVYQGDWQVISGQYAFNYNGITETDGITVADTTGFTDITYTGKLKVTEGTPQVHFIFRFGSYNGYNLYSGYSFLYDIGLESKWSLYKFYSSGGYTKIASEPSSSSLVFDQWYNVKIEASGSHILCYIDNVLKIDTYDSTYNTGKIGLRGDVSKIYFDDIIISNSGNDNPNEPTNPSPANNASGVDINVEISWSCIDPNGDPLTYDVYFGTTNPPNIIVSTGQTDNSYKPTPAMNYLTTYYWKIVAKDNQGATATSPIWSFRTSDEPNNPPTKPCRPNGPSSGYASYIKEFSTSSADPDNDQIKYGWDWGDGSPLQWSGLYPSNNTCKISHIWDNPGIYNIQVKAKDSKGAVSDWSEVKTIEIILINKKPNAPSQPQGTTEGEVNIEYEYRTSATDADNDQIRYGWDWDGNDGVDEWSKLLTSGYTDIRMNSWDIANTYNIKVRVEDEHGALSDWSQVLIVIITNNYPTLDLIYPEENNIVSGLVNITGIASDSNGNETLTLVEVKIDNKPWQNATGTEHWNYSWDTTKEISGDHTIYARSFDGENYSDMSIVNVTVSNSKPEIIITNVGGGFGVQVDVKNIGGATAYDIPWSISVEENFCLFLSGNYTEDMIDRLDAGCSTTIKFQTLRGIGTITITVQADDAVKEATAFLLGSLVLRVT